MQLLFQVQAWKRWKFLHQELFASEKNRTILTTKIEYHRLMCNHFWKTLITICRLLIMRLILCQTLDWLFSLSSNFLWYSEFKIMCSPSAPYLAKNQPIKLTTKAKTLYFNCWPAWSQYVQILSNSPVCLDPPSSKVVLTLQCVPKPPSLPSSLFQSPNNRRFCILHPPTALLISNESWEEIMFAFS